MLYVLCGIFPGKSVYIPSISHLFSMFWTDLELELASLHKETANLNKKVTELTTQLSVANSQLTEEIEKKDKALNHKVCQCMILIVVMCVYVVVLM